MRTISALILIGSLFSLSGCYDNSTPKNTVKTAAYAIQKNNLASFRSVLTGAAKDQYGTQQGMMLLQRKLGSMGKLSIASVVATSSQQSVNANYSLYKVSAIGSRAGQMSAMVICRVTQESRPLPMPPKTVGPQRYHMVDVTRCLISEI